MAGKRFIDYPTSDGANPSVSYLLAWVGTAVNKIIPKNLGIRRIFRGSSNPASSESPFSQNEVNLLVGANGISGQLYMWDEGLGQWVGPVVVGVEYVSTPPNSGNFEGRVIFDNSTKSMRLYKNGGYVQIRDAINTPLGNSATLNVGTTAGTVAAGNDPRFPSAFEKQALGASLSPSSTNAFVTVSYLSNATIDEGVYT